MLKNLKIGFFAILAISFFASCQNANKDVRDAARDAVQPANEVTANTPTPATPAPQEAAVDVGPTTTIEFEETEYDFGEVAQGEKVTHVYKFKNTGNEPLIVTNAKGSCGCTVPEKPTEPVAPGETGEIKVVLNTKNKKGNTQQKVTITANTVPSQTFVHIKGHVQVPEGAEEPSLKVTQ